MAELSERDINNIVQYVIAELQERRGAPDGTSGVFTDVTSAVAASARAQKMWIALPLEKRKEVIAHLRERLRENSQVLAWAAWRETGYGRYEDKIEKNLLVTNKTPGIEDLEPTAWSGRPWANAARARAVRRDRLDNAGHQSNCDDDQQHHRDDCGR